MLVRNLPEIITVSDIVLNIIMDWLIIDVSLRKYNNRLQSNKLIAMMQSILIFFGYEITEGSRSQLNS